MIYEMEQFMPLVWPLASMAPRSVDEHRWQMDLDLGNPLAHNAYPPALVLVQHCRVLPHAWWGLHRGFGSISN